MLRPIWKKHALRQAVGRLPGTSWALVALVAGALWCAGPVGAEVRLPDIFSDHMVLQRGAPITIWGWADSGEKVTVTLEDKEAEAVADAQGRWQVVFDPFPLWKIFRPGQMVVQGTNTITLENVIIGEVWLAAGDAALARTVAQAGGEVPMEPHDYARLFMARPDPSATHPWENIRGRWVVCDADTLSDGGDLSMLGVCASLALREAAREATGLIVYAAPEADIRDWAPATGANAPGGPLFEALWRPLQPMAIKGLIWQDEMDAAMAAPDYGQRLTGLMDGLRAFWDQDDFGFLVVQPSPAGDGATWAAAQARHIQTRALNLGDGWRRTEFFGRSDVREGEDGAIVIDAGDPMSGVTWSGAMLRHNYEIRLETQRIEGGDFFCALTFPVGPDNCSLILGGWGGGLCGLSSLNHADASNNQTMTHRTFESGRWYEVRLQVTPEKILAWLDGEPLVDVEIEGVHIDVRIEVEPAKPLGVSSYYTSSAFRNLTQRSLLGAGQAPDSGRELAMATRLLRPTALVVTSDMPDGLDPAQTAWRIAQAARGVAYSRLSPSPLSPMLAGFRREDGQMRLFFAHTGMALQTADGEAPRGFHAGMGDDPADWSPAPARIEGDTVVVELPDPQAHVCYAWHDLAQTTPNVVNERGLPLAPMKTD